MHTVFLCCAAIGGTILAIQFLLLLTGFGGDHDVSGETGHDQGAFLKLFSVQTISTFTTFFGLVGLATDSLAWSPISVIGAASLAGVAALWMVARLMRGLAALHSQGNQQLAQAVGHTARVYLRIPPAGQGHGRVMLQLQDRTLEVRAASAGGELPTGAEVRVLACEDDEVLLVGLLAEHPAPLAASASGNKLAHGA